MLPVRPRPSLLTVSLSPAPALAAGDQLYCDPLFHVSEGGSPALTEWGKIKDQ